MPLQISISMPVGSKGVLILFSTRVLLVLVFTVAAVRCCGNGDSRNCFFVDTLDETIGTTCLFTGRTRRALKPLLPLLTLAALRQVSGFQILVLFCPSLNVLST